jgi:ABC-type lipoprotein release transport system permease subunit
VAVEVDRTGRMRGDGFIDQASGPWLVGTGLAAGMLGAVAFTRVLRSALFGVAPTDPFTVAVGAVLHGSIAFAACYLPARRASRVDPLLALRHE